MSNSRVTVHLDATVDKDPLVVWHPGNNLSLRLQDGLLDVDVWLNGTPEQLERFVIDLDVEIHEAIRRHVAATA
jgi:hypothetical protein